MSISYRGYEANTITFEAGEGLAIGMPVTVGATGAAVPADEDDYFIGICTAIRNEWASVQTSGYTEVAYSGDAPSLGLSALTADGEGAVKAGEEGSLALYKVLKTDTAAGTVGFIL